MGVAGLDAVAALVAATTSFGKGVLEVGDADWDNTSPCPDWNVRALVAHVVVGDAAAVNTLAGHTNAQVDDVDASILGTDARAAWRGTALTMLKAFQDETDLERAILHPSGDRTVTVLAGFRTWDNVVHAWDLHMALDRDFEIAHDLAEFVIDFAIPYADRIRDSGQFGGGMVDPGPDASPSERLLGLSGRGRS